MPRWMLWIQAEQEYGTTTPVVPRIDSPPTIPSRAFSVRAASASPPGTAISTTASTLPPATSASAARIIWRGTGLIAGSPGGSGKPGSVTVPTPSPAWNTTPLPRRPCRTVACTSAPCVTSGSSPASFTMAARAASWSSAVSASAKAGRSPRGSLRVTGSGNRPVSSAAYAALAAAAAQAPVVQPRRSFDSGTVVRAQPPREFLRCHRCAPGSAEHYCAWVCAARSGDGLASSNARGSGSGSAGPGCPMGKEVIRPE